MDYSKHSILASRFATLALVFSVSACMLSRSMVEEEKMDAKQAATEKNAKDAPAKEPAKDQKATADSKDNKSNASKAFAKEQKPAKAEPVKAISQKPTKATAHKTEVKKNDVAKKDAKQPDAKVVEQTRQPATQAKEDTNKKVVRFVNVETLNVRMHASMDAPVVGKLTLGTMYHVTVEGQWAKIGENQWVMTRFLTTQQPRRSGSTWTMRK